MSVCISKFILYLTFLMILFIFNYFYCLFCNLLSVGCCDTHFPVCWTIKEFSDSVILVFLLNPNWRHQPTYILMRLIEYSQLQCDALTSRRRCRAAAHRQEGTNITLCNVSVFSPPSAPPLSLSQGHHSFSMWLALFSLSLSPVSTSNIIVIVWYNL